MADNFNAILADADDAIVDALGETVTITGRGTVVGVFDERYDEALSMQGTVPMFEYLDADLPALAAGDELIRAGTSYTVRIKQPDGTGMVTLVLEQNG